MKFCVMPIYGKHEMIVEIRHGRDPEGGGRKFMNVEQERKFLKCLLAERTRKPIRWGVALQFLLFIGTVAVLLAAKYFILSTPERALIVLGCVVMWGALVGFGIVYARQASSAPLARDYLDYERIKTRLNAIHVS